MRTPTAGRNKLIKGKAIMDAVELVDVLGEVEVLLILGQISVAFTIKLAEIQTCGSPFVTDVNICPYCPTFCVVHDNTSIITSPSTKFVSPIAYGPNSPAPSPRFERTVTIL